MRCTRRQGKGWGAPRGGGGGGAWEARTCLCVRCVCAGAYARVGGRRRGGGQGGTAHMCAAGKVEAGERPCCLAPSHHAAPAGGHPCPGAAPHRTPADGPGGFAWQTTTGTAFAHLPASAAWPPGRHACVAPAHALKRLPVCVLLLIHPCLVGHVHRRAWKCGSTLTSICRASRAHHLAVPAALHRSACVCTCTGVRMPYLHTTAPYRHPPPTPAAWRVARRTWRPRMCVY